MLSYYVIYCEKFRKILQLTEKVALTYWQALEYYDITNLEERLIGLCKSTYEKIKEPDNVIHHLLPPTRENTYNLRIYHQHRPCNTRVKRSDGSFINYDISMFE